MFPGAAVSPRASIILQLRHTPNTLQRLQALSSLYCWQPAVRAADPAHYAANAEARGSSCLSACADNAACLGHLLIRMH